MQISAADAAPGDLHLHLPWRGRRWIVYLFYPNILSSMPYRRFHVSSSENPLWGGAEGVAFGVGPMVRDNPPLRPSRGGESSSFLVVPIFMLCGAGHAGKDDSPENPPYQDLSCGLPVPCSPQDIPCTLFKGGIRFSC